ncbi:hypothetical protein Vadar_029217 [Vaccinium darrowii]|uniref:Uncharacterized protein n=1 Tax=Vaccinium darrowii TaxID=229202 RepID=A0ACB7Z197_9ERIC|nr:hypothetical protein Vadar_029217 [Vaccinium darrowii]
MEGEKKRKRVEDGEAGGGRRRRKETGPKPEAEAAAATPTDEEVDEFFAILRRMHVAVKYFEKGSNSSSSVHAGGGRKLTGRWATALEAEVLGGVKGVKNTEEAGCGVRKNGGLDLNAVPEAESNSL